MKIALPEEFFSEGLEEEVRERVLMAARALERLGAEIVQVHMPSLKNALPAYYVLSSAEASSNLARFDGIKYGYRAREFEGIDELYARSRSQGFGPEVKRRIMLGSFVLSAGYYDAYYKKAQAVRTLIRREFEHVLERCDIILSASCAHNGLPDRREERGSAANVSWGYLYCASQYCGAARSLSPIWSGENALPIGVQLIGRALGEAEIYQVAYALEQERGAF